MKKKKYIVIDERNAIVFSETLTHKEIAGYGYNITGAGFVSFEVGQDEYGCGTITAHCYGESVSLGVASNPKDSDIVTRELFSSYF